LSKEQAFLDFVLSHYVRVGVQELDQEKLTPLLRLNTTTQLPTRWLTWASAAVMKYGTVSTTRRRTPARSQPRCATRRPVPGRPSQLQRASEQKWRRERELPSGRRPEDVLLDEPHDASNDGSRRLLNCQGVAAHSGAELVPLLLAIAVRHARASAVKAGRKAN
jgi:hypothetical protein